jgi:hypothetical protein
VQRPVRLLILTVLAVSSSCSLLVPDLSSQFGIDSGFVLDAGLTADGGDAGAPDAGPSDGGGLGDAGPPDAGPVDAGLDAGAPDAGNLCADAGPTTWCEDFESFDAGRYAEVTPFDGGNGVVVDGTRAVSPSSSLRVLHAVNAPGCSDALAGRDFTGGPYSTLRLSTAVRFERRQPMTSLFYVQRGTGSAICAIYVRAMSDGRLALLEQIPTTPGMFDFFSDESDAGLDLGTWHRVELDFTPSNAISIHLDGRVILSRAVSRACTAPASAVEFKLGSICSSSEAQPREFWLDDMRFDAR